VRSTAINSLGDTAHSKVRASIPLKIAAKVDPADQEYFAHVIEPLIDDPLVEPAITRIVRCSALGMVN
jgi:hypothetical protein